MEHDFVLVGDADEIDVRNQIDDSLLVPVLGVQTLVVREFHAADEPVVGVLVAKAHPAASFLIVFVGDAPLRIVEDQVLATVSFAASLFRVNSHRFEVCAKLFEVLGKVDGDVDSLAQFFLPRNLTFAL